jgi:hypothetical protein
VVTQVGPDVYQLPHNPTHLLIKPAVTFDWTAHGRSGLPSSGCTVVAQVTGPGGYNQTRRSADCSGSPNSALDVVTPGTYTISISVTPPSGGSAVTATKTFQIVAADH